MFMIVLILCPPQMPCRLCKPNFMGVSPMKHIVSGTKKLPMYHCVTRWMGWLTKEQEQTTVGRKMRTRLAVLLLSPPFDA